MGFQISILLFIILSIAFHQSVVFDLPIVAEAKDELSPGEELSSLNTTSNLISANGKFTLGFFTIPSTNLTYLGIWYTQHDEGIKVWVANRDKPMIDNGVLIIDDYGTLKIISGSGSDQYFNISNDQVGSGKKTRALLQDSGNFLVYDPIENQTLWQSFDHPTDTFLTGMKLGYNLTTNQNQTMTCWLSDQVPATGSFRLSLEQYQNTTQALIRWRGEVYWASGPWDEDTRDFLFPSAYFKVVTLFQYNLSLISDASGSYVTFQTPASTSLAVQISPDGQVIELIDGALNHFNVTPEFCYGYEYHGCVEAASTVLPNCRGESDGFELKSGDWIGGSSNYDGNSSISRGDCMERCWRDCNCIGFTTGNSNGTGCRTWGGDKPFQLDESGQTVQKYVLVSQKHGKKKSWKWILVSLASVLLFVSVTYVCYVIIRRHKREGLTSSNNGNELDIDIKDARHVKIFGFSAILAATDNFSNENKIGEGGYGPVFKGKLSDGREIAVKRLSKTSSQGTKEFNSELILISKLQHTNLVRLYGCCIHRKEKMLIYEFLPNKSLDFFLFDEDKKKKLDWRIRFNMIGGIAQGLLYLHKYSRMKVIHRDLKVSNILLDDNMNPKIADFGLARIFQENVAKAMTKNVVGTYGYIAPEYAMRGTFSTKSDVFSFGVLIIEIVSGQKNSNFYKYNGTLNLMGYAWELWKSDAALELRDESLGDSYDVEQLLRSIHVGLLCVQEKADDRPTMSEVISMLNNEIACLPTLKQPAFFIATQPAENGLVERNISPSVNGLTLTQMEPR